MSIAQFSSDDKPQANNSTPSTDRYRIGVFTLVVSAPSSISAWMNEQANDGYRLHSMTIDPSGSDYANALIVVMEKEYVG